MKQEYLYNSEIQEIPRIRQELKLLSENWNIPTTESHQIQVIIEELFSNIVRFAYQDNHDHQVKVRLRKNNSEIEIEIVDDGIPFNPLEHDLVTTSDPATMDEGGMGLTLIQTFSDSINYSRNGNKNVLRIGKKIKSSS